MFQKLNGNKINIGYITGGVVGILISFDIITWEQAQPIMVVIGAWTGVAYSHRSNKMLTAIRAKKNG